MSPSTAADSAHSHRESARDEAIGPGDRAAYLLHRARRLTTPLIRLAVDTLPGQFRLMAGYHLGWCAADGATTTAAAGKGLRPALVLAAAEAAGGAPGAALHAAAAVEMVHNFTLIHDDVMDGDPLRRGRPAVWRLWGADDAVLVGDALHSLAIWTLAEGPAAAPDAIARLEDAVIEVCLGHRDRAGSGSGVELTAGPEALRRRSSALLGCACAMGALCAGAPSEVVAAMDQLGRDLAHATAAATIPTEQAGDLLALAECFARQ